MCFFKRLGLDAQASWQPFVPALRLVLQHLLHGEGHVVQLEVVGHVNVAPRILHVGREEACEVVLFKLFNIFVFLLKSLSL